MFGVLEPGCYGALEVDSNTCHIFIPRLPEEYATWMGTYVLYYSKNNNQLFLYTSLEM